MEYKFEQYEKITTNKQAEEKKIRCMAYITCSRPKSKLINRQTDKVTFSHFPMTE